MNNVDTFHQKIINQLMKTINTLEKYNVDEGSIQQYRDLLEQHLNLKY